MIKLESYEDALNNLELRRTSDLENILSEFSSEERDNYLMRYLLAEETKEAFLSAKDFTKPFDYQLMISTISAGSSTKRRVDLIETFNYLIGITIDKYISDSQKGFVLVIGVLPDRRHALIVWRDCEKIDQEGLVSLLEIARTNAKGEKSKDFDIIYINGDIVLPGKKIVGTGKNANERQKISCIEPVFLERMFG